MNVYLTAFGFGDENENKKNNFKKGQIVTEKKLEKSNNSTNSTTASKPEIELLPLKQNNIYVYLLSTKEYFNFGVGKNNGYYSITHFTPDKKYDWFIFTNNINEKRRIYSSGKKGEKGSQKLVYIDVNDTGFDVSDLENKLLWSIEKKDSDYYLKKGSNKDFAYKFVKFKQKSSTVLDCYMMHDANNKAKSISWKTENGLYVFDENKKEKFYIPKCNPNSQNEPALAFPNIYLLEELNIKLRNIIAIEMSQLE